MIGRPYRFHYPWIVLIFQWVSRLRGFVTVPNSVVEVGAATRRRGTLQGGAMSRTKIPPTDDYSITRQAVRNPRETWPTSVLNAAGALPDFPSPKEIRKGYGRDARRLPPTAPANRRLASLCGRS